MRNRKIAFTAILSLLAGISVYSFTAKTEDRKPASTAKSTWRPAPVGKHLALFHVELKSEDEIPESGTDEVILVGRVLVNQTLQGDLAYTWSLPEGVSVVDGITSDTLSGVKVGQVVELKLTVVGFSKEKQKAISLAVKALAKEEVLGNSAVIVSRNEDTMEATAPGMKRSAEEQLGSETVHRRRK
ncbi:hypothetical protein AB1A81_00890 [Bdellovibrio bacteriovorus]|uniref:Uncharacterized protein n=1 Tax=Bdellovibrio bacteriovorus (strain ATCC 15356 / DSM 50701 / NCIMB 9529 / HD100) TaxID=264462 RepID=Q6MRA0_BDEBA|nr:hypothetical protein [Bdellovibrio bacteriovorus]AHZ85834.1 hypothetical protein EP01_12935 [Bdellovibrio bacteriovorus]BEV66754.1 hypothetical protein Bb109J_c0174 [Bdellovibrio bacteriovorus]CAE77858.1 hypothetical protein predicted by Glimmer/Critica [Bdellovibrio bacteriovorus HD100]